MTCARPEEASEDDGAEAGLGEAVRGGSGADVGQPSVGRMGGGADEELAVGAGPADDEVAPVSGVYHLSCLQGDSER